MIVEHLALPQDWRAALAAGRYTASTRGRSLAEEGFVHASRPDQTAAVRQRYYADVPELVLLTIDTDLLDVPWRLDRVGDDEFPHLYGPVRIEAVVATRTLTA